MSACASYADDLARLLAEEEIAPAERARLCEALRRHARECPACGASADLIEVLEDREGAIGASEPGAAYWATFNERVHRRIEAEARSRTTVPWRVLGAVAAALAILLVALWVSFERVRTPESGPSTAEVSDPLRDALAELSASSGEELEVAAEVYTGWASSPEDGATGSELFPELGDLTSEQSERLLEWLQRERS